MFLNLDINFIELVELVFVTVSFFVLFYIFIKDRYPIELKKDLFTLGIVLFLVIINGNSTLSFIFSNYVDYLNIYLFSLSLISFALIFFIFKLSV